MLATCAVLLLAVPLQRELIQPRTLSSPTGGWTAHLNPSSKRGDGPSHVTVSHGAERAWEADLSFTFWEARIADSGHVFGYGFTEGPKAMGHGGDFVVAIFGPDGLELLHESIALTSSRSLHTPPNPNPSGLFIQPELDRAVLRLEDEDVNRNDETWQVYRLSTGEKLESVQPKHRLERADVLPSSMAAHSISDRPLTLVQWYRVSDQATGQYDVGTRFVLVDAEWHAVWELELPRDYDHADEDESDRRLFEAFDRGGILENGEPGRFELRHVATGQRVTYEVAATSGGTGWAVREVARAPDEPATAALEMPLVELRELATIPLKIGPARERGPVHDILAFAVGATGNVRYVRDEERGVTLLSLDGQGAVVEETLVDPIVLGEDGTRRWHALDEGRWLFTLSPFGDDVTSRAWLADARTGIATEIEGFEGPSVESVSATPEGGFVVLGHFNRPNTMEDALIAFDREGTRRWEIVQRGYRGTDDELLGADDLVVERDGSVLVLDNVRDAVQVFDATGHFVRLVELAEAFDKRNYLTTFLVEPAGTWLVFDFAAEGGGAWQRVDREGRPLERLVPRVGDGGERGRADACRIDAAGGFWTTDGQALYRLDDEGVLQPRFGLEPEASELEEAWSIAFDERGRLAVRDRRTRALHLFDSNGERVSVLRPEVTDGDRLGWMLEGLVTAPDGRIFVKAEDAFRLDDDYLEFASGGRRVGWCTLGGDFIAFTPEGGRWSARPERYAPCSVAMQSADGTPVVTHARRPNGDFWLEIDALGCGPDGSASVLTGAAEARLELDLYSAEGVPVRTIALPGAESRFGNRLSHGEKWIVVSSYRDEAFLVPLGGGQSVRVRVAGSEEKTSCAVTLSPDGKELWSATQRPLALHRYAMPEAP